QFQGHSQAVYALCEGRKPETFFSAGADKMVAEWNLATGKAENFSVKSTETIYSLFYWKSKNLLFVGNAGGGLHVIDLHLKKEARYFTLHKKGVFFIKIFEETNHLVLASADGTVSFWNPIELALI